MPLQTHIYVYRISKTCLLDSSHFQLSNLRKITFTSESPVSDPAYTIKEDHMPLLLLVLLPICILKSNDI